MARGEAEKEEDMEAKNASNEESRGDDVVAIDLPAPQGWKKKFTPKKGGTPRRNEIVFISPTGEEIKNKRQLDQYLKSHPEGPSASEFDWGTGDTPRRSARISGKSKGMETPESEPPKKAQKKSSSKKGSKQKDDIDAEGETAEEQEAAEEEIKGSAEVEMKDAEDVGDHDKGEVSPEEAPADEDNMKDPEQKTEIEVDDINKENPESEGATNGTSAVKKDDDAGDNKSLPMPGLEQADPEAPSQLQVPNETAPSEQEAVPELEEADMKAEKESEDVKVGQEARPNKEETPTTEKKVDKVEEDASSSDKGNLKNQEVGKPTENNNTASCEEAPHEPKAPQVSC